MNNLSILYFINAIPLGKCEKAKACDDKHAAETRRMHPDPVVT